MNKKLPRICLLSPLAALTLALTLGCGSEDPTIGSTAGLCANSPVVGQWKHTQDSSLTLTLDAQCNLQTQPCGTTGTYPPVSAQEGEILVTITGSGTGSSCMALGLTVCVYSLELIEGKLYVDCGVEYGWAFYEK